MGKSRKRIQAKRTILNNLSQSNKDGVLSNEINSLKKEINNLLDDEELYQGQQAKAHWLKERDKNTKFFHAQASERRKQNTIVGIWDEQGNWCDEKESIAHVAISYFKNIYTTTHSTQVEEVTAAIPSRVTDDMNERVDQVFTREEVVTTLKQIHPTKAPGLNGMSALVYQKYWNVVGNGITNMVLNVLNNNVLVAELNKTNISLIPKTNSPKKMTDFHPISLCNVVYKLISKTLANRLKALLPHIIIKNQSAFTSNHLITNNVIVAFELMHFLNHKSAGIEGFMAAKLDMSKAFDRAEWCFIQGVMERMGFSTRWINLIMKCITSVSYSVLINGVAYGNIKPTCGIRQGDPLSSSIFLLYAQGLSALIHEAA